MGADSKIEWCYHTFNPIWGCARVSPGCENCYAEAFAKRTGHKVWGVNGERRVFGDRHWAEPLKWNAAAERAGARHRVFCASMADVFENHVVWEIERPRLWKLIAETPNLDWLLLTKRPENIWELLPEDWRAVGPWPNVWLGTTVEDQQRADERIPHLLRVPAAVRFLSCEPLLEPVDLSNFVYAERDYQFHLAACDVECGGRCYCKDGQGIQWVIVGGESGPGARRFNVEWARSIVRQCREAGVAVHVKQMGGHVIDRNDRFDTAGDSDNVHDWPWSDRDPDDVEHNINGFREEYQGAPVRIRLLDRKGGNWDEWPPDLRIREYPEVRR